LGIDSVWITRKHPFLVYLFLAILPMLLLGDPLAYLIR
jgi:prepilin signal peptidase PulO-like enzyme (type II secretory pathway)